MDGKKYENMVRQGNSVKKKLATPITSDDMPTPSPISDKTEICRSCV